MQEQHPRFPREKNFEKRPMPILQHSIFIISQKPRARAIFGHPSATNRQRCRPSHLHVANHLIAIYNHFLLFFNFLAN
jgi:hypothetical protein